jgi:hypothetical protein
MESKCSSCDGFRVSNGQQYVEITKLRTKDFRSEQLIAGLLEEKSSSASALSEIKSMVQKLTTQVTIMAANITDLTSDNVILKKEITDLTYDNVILKKKITDLTSDNVILKNNVDDISSIVNSLFKIRLMNTATQIILFLVGEQPRSFSSPPALTRFNNAAKQDKRDKIAAFIVNFELQANDLISTRNEIVHPGSIDALDTEINNLRVDIFKIKNWTFDSSSSLTKFSLKVIDNYEFIRNYFG